MTQLPITTWCETLQAKLMAALDAVWAILETSDDPAEIRKARDKAKACGELAAVARKVAALAGLGRPKGAAEAPPALPVRTPNTVPASVQAPAVAEAPPPIAAQVEHARRALEQLKGGRRGRL